MRYLGILATLGFIILPAISVSAAGKSLRSCTQGCALTVLVKGCDGTPLEGVPVELALKCEPPHQKMLTNRNGEAKFDVCLKDVQQRKVGSFVERVVEAGGDERNSTIEMTLCEE